MSASQLLRLRWRELRNGRPGQRFQQLYERARTLRQRLGPLRRLAMLVVATLCLGIGLFLVVFPGPAIPFLLVSGALLALESKPIARLMDWLELRGRAIWRWGRKIWCRVPAGGRVFLLVLGSGLSLTCTYVAYRLFH